MYSERKYKICLNENWELKKIPPTDRIIYEELASGEEDWLPIQKMPAQVQDILLSHGLLPEEMRIGWCRETLWIGDFDWVYRCTFPRPSGKNVRICFDGLDTYADV